jgi:hypothetical protein
MRARMLAAATLAATLTGCDNVSFNAPQQPCPEISEAEFEAALSNGDTRGDVEISSLGAVSMRIGGSMKSCRTPPGPNPVETCRRSRDLVVRYETASDGVFFVRVPSGKWHRFDPRNAPRTCRLMPG